MNRCRQAETVMITEEIWHTRIAHTSNNNQGQPYNTWDTCYVDYLLLPLCTCCQMTPFSGWQFVSVVACHYTMTLHCIMFVFVLLYILQERSQQVKLIKPWTRMAQNPPQQVAIHVLLALAKVLAVCHGSLTQQKLQVQYKGSNW